MLLYLSIFTVVLSLLLVYNNRNINHNTIFLAFFLMLISLYGITHYFTIYSNSVFWLAVFYSHFSPLMLLMGPFLYFYIRNTLNDQQGLGKRDFFHFLPAIIHFIGQVPYLFKPFSYKKAIAKSIILDLDILPKVNTNVFYSAVIGYSMRTLLMTVYVLYCIYLLWDYYSEKRSNNDVSKQYKLTFKWLLILIFSTSLMVFNFFVITSIGIFEHPSDAFKNIYPLHIISLVAFLTMTFSLLLFPNILYGIPISVNQKEKSQNATIVKETSQDDKNKKNVASKGTFVEKERLLQLHNPDDSLFEVAESIKKYLIEKKPYLDPEFSQFTISVDLKIPLNHISYCFAYIFEKKFNVLRMELRVNHSIKLLKEGLNENITIDAISQEAGFSSRSNFYAAFKKITNTTPTEYISNNSNL